ncbi:formylmethanofuran dehydrogenase subunit E [Desulfuromusa kysingii]|uniref:Formylmethanofuran dehydrogenase subunit E n=1 Tax=Desulfuromusa kysingii TaxID=37625 RepID=A0A1H3ZVB5_9BACT|nr:FmdE family protein [Desulfuromusa kysingii]SEA27222.1 formylmethanofuran dehydrogenase subunit E [Desulfuromusa kysingii]
MHSFEEYYATGLKFHGHKCPAMPMGLRAGLAAMKALGVERSQDKELRVLAETGDGHAAGCFVDGIMTATGCTYGKSNIEKLYYNKMAFTLIDVKTGRSVRVSLKNEVFSQALKSPFIEQRKAGVLPQNIPAEITNPVIEKIFKIPEEMLLNIGEIEQVELLGAKGVFTAEPCAICGELTFTNKLQDTDAGRVCIPCAK